jgi:hypothetical protein
MSFDPGKSPASIATRRLLLDAHVQRSADVVGVGCAS